LYISIICLAGILPFSSIEDLSDVPAYLWFFGVCVSAVQTQAELREFGRQALRKEEVRFEHFARRDRTQTELEETARRKKGGCGRA
jgi:hypothetical protein